MIKIIKNSKSSITNLKCKYKGISFSKGKYVAVISISRFDKQGKRKQIKFNIGTYATEKKALKARIDYILKLL